jgi:hypothetical protein
VELAALIAAEQSNAVLFPDHIETFKDIVGLRVRVGFDGIG